MAQNKNQHFVPKCYLRPFGTGNEGRAINLFNHRSGRAIPAAPIKGQCSRSYFYGEDLEIEHILQSIEGDYAAIIAKMLDTPTGITNADLCILREFALLQHCRTEYAAARQREAMLAMHEITFRAARNIKSAKIDELDVSHGRVVLGGLRAFAKGLEHIADLSVIIVRNETRREFITSDDPAVLTNRVHLQRLKSASFGFISCGTQLILPLTPRFTLICYDADAYAAPGRSQFWLSINRDQDVAALNELQMLKCDANIYFREWKDRAIIAKEFNAAAARRVPSHSKLWVGVQTHEDNRGESYRKATDKEIGTTATKLVAISPVYPVPQRWFSGLPFKPTIVGYTNGNGAAVVRSAFASNHAEGPHFARVEVTATSHGTLIRDNPETAFRRRSIDLAKPTV